MWRSEPGTRRNPCGTCIAVLIGPSYAVLYHWSASYVLHVKLNDQKDTLSPIPALLFSGVPYAVHLGPSHAVLYHLSASYVVCVDLNEQKRDILVLSVARLGCSKKFNSISASSPLVERWFYIALLLPEVTVQLLGFIFRLIASQAI